MAYCKQADLLTRVPEDELVQVTDDAGSGTIDADVIAAAISSADAQIDASLMERYTVPFTTAPAIVKWWSQSIALWILYNRREGAGEASYRRSINNEYRRAIEMLDRVSAGSLSLGVGGRDSGVIKVDGPDQFMNSDKRSQYEGSWEE